MLPCMQSTKLLNIIGSMKTKVLYKFGTSKTKGVEIKTEKVTECVQSTEHVKSCVYLILSHTEHTSTMSLVNQYHL